MAHFQGLARAFSQGCSTSTPTSTSGWSPSQGQQVPPDAVCVQSHGGKGKDVVRSLDWHLAAMASNDKEREEITYGLLQSLPRSVLASLQRRITPLLQFDIVSSIPTELALLIFTHLSAASLLTCSLVCKRWHALTNDQGLWHDLCRLHGWEWRADPAAPATWRGLGDADPADAIARGERDEDEGMGDEEVAVDEGSGEDAGHAVDPLVENDSENIVYNEAHGPRHLMIPVASSSSLSPAVVPLSRITSQRRAHLVPDYKLLHQTHRRLRNRFYQGTYHRRALPCADNGGHTAAVYCLWLWTYPAGLDGQSAPLQVLFTGSKDRTVREWDLRANRVRRVVSGLHDSSVLSLCISSDFPTSAAGEDVSETSKPSGTGLLVSGGSDMRVVVWDLGKNRLVKMLQDHLDSVLCVRVGSGRLVTCSKDRTVRTYAFPSLKPQFVFRAHRAAVNAVSVIGNVIVSGSGDRSVHVWNADTGELISTFEDHHTRGIASIEFRPPYLLTGSSDMHVRMFDMHSSKGWSTGAEFHPFNSPPPPPPPPSSDSIVMMPGQGAGALFLHSSLVNCVSDTPRAGETTVMCGACGSQGVGARREQKCHTQLVRSVALGEELAVSGSYDLTIKVWDKKTGALVADLTGGHTGRIFCVGFDCTKIVSCGEDQRICIWDFSHGIDTSFIKL